MKNQETFESLWEYCISNNRVCLKPVRWNDLFNLLKEKDRLNVPLILNGWEMSSPLEKNMRFEEHIKSASNTDQITEISEYIKTIPESDWAHYGEV